MTRRDTSYQDIAPQDAEAVQKLLAEIDLEALSAELHEELEKATGQKRVRLLKRQVVPEKQVVSKRITRESNDPGFFM